MPGQIEGDHAEWFVTRRRRAVPRLPPVGAGGVQAHQRNARAGLLDIDAVRLAADLEMDVAADHRLDIALMSGTFPFMPPWQRQRFLEIAQMGHERSQVALGLAPAPLDQRH